MEIELHELFQAQDDEDRRLAQLHQKDLSEPFTIGDKAVRTKVDEYMLPITSVKGEIWVLYVQCNASVSSFRDFVEASWKVIIAQASSHTSS
jgi:hypothetical protein